MDTEGPVSVLDRRPRATSRDRVVIDRLTRQRSPGPGPRFKPTGVRGRNEPDEPQDVIYRISQPYRTSFSAKHSVTWGKAERSRSLSPTSSLYSNASLMSAPPTLMTRGGLMTTTTADKRRPRGRSKSPKKVTYNRKVTVRHSDTEDSMFAELSSYELEDDSPMRPIVHPLSRSIISPRYNEFSQLSPISLTSPQHQSSTARSTPRFRDHYKPGDDTPRTTHYTSGVSRNGVSPRERDSGLDFSTEIKDLSNQITHMQWSPRQNRALQPRQPALASTNGQVVQHPKRPNSASPTSPPGILKDSQNSRGLRQSPTNGVISHGNGSVREGPSIGLRTSPNRTSPARTMGDKENDPSGSPTKHPQDLQPNSIIARDYEHDRPFSYEKAVKGDYGEDIQKMAVYGLAEAHNEQQQQQQQRQDNVDANDTSGDPKMTSSEEVTSSSPVNTSQGESSPGRGSPVESGRLTPSKRSVSLSITNFLKRFSPHLRRKPSKERGSKSSAGSAQSLTSDPDTDRDSPTQGKGRRSKKGHFSRSRVRRSFLKLVGRSGSSSKKKGPSSSEEVIPTPSHYTIELQDPDRTLSSDEVDEIANGFVANSSVPSDNQTNGKTNFKSTTTQRIMKSIEQNHVAEQDIYRRFKDRQSPRGGPDGLPPTGLKSDPLPVTTLPNSSPHLTKPHPLRPTNHHMTTTTSPSPRFTTPRDSLDGPMEFFTATDIEAILCPEKARNGTLSPQQPMTMDNISLSRAEPPGSLDVLPSRKIRLLQTSVMSSISGDESIGECSLDCNLTASEPSLLSGINNQSGVSRQVGVPHSLIGSTDVDDVKSHRTPQQHHRSNNKENEAVTSHYSPKSSLSDPPSPVDPDHKPSYLKLSCAISGYGKYSRYSTYKDVNKRSPYSSQNSLRSETSSPEPTAMPAEQRSGDESTPEHKGGARVTTGWNRSNGRQANTPISVNGHSPKYPTGDVSKDGEYFLQHTQFEEDRLRGLATRAEVYLRSQNMPEEACGRIRSAIGKANLLLTQKFVQFRELCASHMQPEAEERETKWEDLQGFWDMIKIQVDNLDDMFAEIELMKQNGWLEIPKMTSRRSSASSSPKSGSVSQASTPSATPGHTPGTKRKNLNKANSKDTPDSSPERTQKARQAAKARDEARRKLLAERRAAMKQAAAAAANSSSGTDVEIYLPEPGKK